MKLCPCGCRRKVPFMRGGAAKAAISVQKSLNELNKISLAVQNQAQAANSCKKHIDEGKRILNWLLDHIHGSAHPSTHPNILQISKYILQWNHETYHFSNSVSNEPNPADTKKIDADIQIIVNILENDAMLSGLPSSVLQDIVPSALRQSISTLDSMGLLEVEYEPIGTIYLEAISSGESIPGADEAHAYAVHAGATDEDFRCWHDQEPLLRYSIMGMHHLATVYYFNSEISRVNSKPIATENIKQRIPQFGSPTPILMTDDNQPLPWETRNRVMRHWQNTNKGNNIPQPFDSATMYYRQLLTSSEI